MKKYKWTLILGSLVTLLPLWVGLILWERLPDILPIHWGLNGNIDAVASPRIVLLLLPALLLALQWLCAWISFRDPKTKRQSPKAMHLALWVVPLTSVFSTAVIYSAAMGNSLNLFRVVPLFLGVLFLVIGNYMPKITQNSYLGIKTPWTLYSEENWNATHRFCGRVWVIWGFFLLLGVFLPEGWPPVLLILLMVVVIGTGLLYPYLYYRRQLEGGLAPIPKKPLTKKSLLSRIALVALILAIAAVLGVILFTGDISLQYGDTSFTIEADFMADLTVEYAAISSVEYVKSPDLGIRRTGFNSARLQMGSFYSKAYGNYTLYAYTGCEEAVLLRSGEKLLLIGGESSEATMEIYESIKERLP